MSEIKVGEYIKAQDEILRVEEIGESWIKFKGYACSDDLESFLKHNYKHSFNIYDLLEENEVGIIKGYCKQEGEPTPDNPIEIKTLELPFENVIPSYKSADKMFEELGYLEIEKHKNSITYIDEENDKEICIIEYDELSDIQGKFVEINGFDSSISMQELQAINQKCKELGWLNE